MSDKTFGKICSVLKRSLSHCERIPFIQTFPSVLFSGWGWKWFSSRILTKIAQPRRTSRWMIPVIWKGGWKGFHSRCWRTNLVPPMTRRICWYSDSNGHRPASIRLWWFWSRHCILFAVPFRVLLAFNRQ